jgi:hypothetical protein
VNHRVLGAYIAAFRDQRGLTVKQKWRVALSIIICLLIGFWLAPRIEGRVCIIIFGSFWLSWLYRYPTAPPLASPSIPLASPLPVAVPSGESHREQANKPS